MDRLISCEFNMDNACVELKFLDGSMIAIDTIAVENEVADNMYQRSELDYLIYNDPVGYCLLYTSIGKGHLMELRSPGAALFFLGLHRICIFGSLHRGCLLYTSRCV